MAPEFLAFGMSRFDVDGLFQEYQALFPIFFQPDLAISFSICLICSSCKTSQKISLGLYVQETSANLNLKLYLRTFTIDQKHSSHFSFLVYFCVLHFD